MYEIYLPVGDYYFREFREEDAEGLFALDADPEVHKYLGNKPIIHIDQSKKIIQDVRAQYKRYGIARWWIIESLSGAYVGWAGLKYETKLRDFSYWDLGYRLRQEYWGKGIATLLSREAIRYGFQEMSLPTICAAAHIENAASLRVLEKLGFKPAGIFDYEGISCRWLELQASDWLAEYQGL